MKVTCEQLVTYLSDYLEDALDTELTKAAEQHLATCKNCRVVLDSTQKTIYLYKQHGAVTQIPVARKEALFDRISKVFEDKSSS